MSMFCWWHSHLPHKHTLAVKLIKYTALTVEQHHSLINARIDSILIWLWWIRWMCVGSLGPFGALLKWTSEHFTLASPPPQTVIKHQACDWPIKGESNRINQLCALWNKEENRIELQAKPERESARSNENVNQSSNWTRHKQLSTRFLYWVRPVIIMDLPEECNKFTFSSSYSFPLFNESSSIFFRWECSKFN